MNSNEVSVQYITSKEGLRAALSDVLSEFNLIKLPEVEARRPATRAEACKFLNISLPTLGKLLNSGQIHYFQIGNQIRINWEDLERYIKKG